jgi:crotonobetainyl-CoA:carnitine CoA-transferase CaiB-like acyl-CoA transferase
MAEMHMHFFQRDGLPMRRCGINRFAPNSPVGIYPCKTGWVGITVASPDQWRGLCTALDLKAQAADEGLATRELRFARIDEVEDVLRQALARHTADEWAAIGRQHRVPIVVVPDAEGMLAHPIFQARQSLATLQAGDRALQVPRTPFGLTSTPVRQVLDAPAAAATAVAMASSDLPPAPTTPPLAGITLVDFSMGWAGPLGARLLGDLGCEVLKIEAGRYPDWWRGMNWTPAFIDGKDYEKATIFCGMNRGKQGISLDLTTPTGRDLALRLVAKADAVIENQAAGVMAKFGLDYAAMSAVKPDIVMCSMSAFGTGNAWSDTRAYGSTLEQGCGLPSLTGTPDQPPTMTHLAHGDPVGGLYGCAALLTALIHKQRSGSGQYANVSMVEAMLQLTTPGLLMHQVDPSAPLRRGNRRDALAPHGFYPCAGSDQWVGLSVDSGAAFSTLCRLIGRRDWAADPALQTLAGRQAIADQIDTAVAAWSRRFSPDQAAALLQAQGISAAGLLHAEHLGRQPALAAAGFYIDVDRAVSGPQRQCGIAIRQGGRRLGTRTPAPLLGEHSAAVLQRHAGVSADDFAALVDTGIVSLAPKPARNLL